MWTLRSSFRKPFYTTDQDLTENGEVLLPKASVLVKMVGGEGNWYCTWVIGDKLSKPANEITAGDRELCLQADADGRTFLAKKFSTNWPELMTITSDKISAFEHQIKETNSVYLRQYNRELYTNGAELKISSQWMDGKVCLQLSIQTMSVKQRECFNGLGQPISYFGGVYTLVPDDKSTEFKVRVDKPLYIRGIAPRSPDINGYASSSPESTRSEQQVDTVGFAGEQGRVSPNQSTATAPDIDQIVARTAQVMPRPFMLSNGTAINDFTAAPGEHWYLARACQDPLSSWMNWPRCR